MRPVQVMFDEELLRRLADSQEVRERGRSEVVRRAVVEYLRRKDREEITRRYRAAYADTSRLDDELGGWETEGEWPAE